MRSRQTEPITSPEFQRLTGYLVALELSESTPGLTFGDCLARCAIVLFRLGEPEPTPYEIEGMRDFYNGVPYITTVRRTDLTDNTNPSTTTTPKNAIDSPDYGFGFSPLEQAMAALFGPTPDMIERMNKHLQEMSDDDQRYYGQRVALNFLADPLTAAYDSEHLIAAAEQFGVKLPELVKTAARETVDAAPRDTFEQAIEKARNTGNAQDEDENLANALQRFNEAEGGASEEDAYQNGIDTGKQFQTGWNTSQFTGHEVLALVEAESGNLNEATKRGILDAYAHYTPVRVAQEQALTTELIAEAFE